MLWSIIAWISHDWFVKSWLIFIRSNWHCIQLDNLLTRTEKPSESQKIIFIKSFCHFTDYHIDSFCFLYNIWTCRNFFRHNRKRWGLGATKSFLCVIVNFKRRVTPGPKKAETNKCYRYFFLAQTLLRRASANQFRRIWKYPELMNWFSFFPNTVWHRIKFNVKLFYVTTLGAAFFFQLKASHRIRLAFGKDFSGKFFAT